MIQISKDLKIIGQGLPYGALKRIAEKNNVSQAYVSKFFNGEYELTDENTKLLNEAEIILTEEAAKDQVRQHKLTSVANIIKK